MQLYNLSKALLKPLTYGHDGAASIMGPDGWVNLNPLVKTESALLRSAIVDDLSTIGYGSVFGGDSQRFELN